MNQEVNFLNRFAHRLNMHIFNIAGNSMGGTIAALYAEKYPAQVHSLAFIGALFGLLDPFSLL
ncbi:alpha/beta fold hydrolase [Coxiella endosymbiont of Ornithodoros maritimus]|uniref:alpha/beta fold hydrolase n=1 Tax=Coxiella endosymbiont of Ornithodoros maritimus TaxID=1656172 RepID=UPI0022643A3D|nr:alpha/beta fold hydrolase [Coxiella endosymbiont of Ornithodoros maritimus]